MTAVLVLTPLLLVGLFIGLLFPVIIRLLRRCSAREITPEWLDSFSVSAYYPMERLLNAEDFRFLSRQPGFDLALYRKLRRERLRIFKQYLNRSIVDFNRLDAAVRLTIAFAPQDCSDVVSRLIRLRVGFLAAVLRSEISYRLCLLGFQTLAVRSLILQLEEMSRQLSLVSATQVVVA